MVPFGACRGLFWLILVLIRREQRKNPKSDRNEKTMATKYTSPAEDAATIRAALKKIYKITSRQVSVKTHTYSMGSSLYININDHKIDIKEVKNISPFRRIAPGQLVRTSTDSLGQFLLSILGVHSAKHQFKPRQNHERTNAMLKEDRNQFPHWWSL
jgi:hypothetical protein